MSVEYSGEADVLFLVICSSSRAADRLSAVEYHKLTVSCGKAEQCVCV